MDSFFWSVCDLGRRAVRVRAIFGGVVVVVVVVVVLGMLLGATVVCEGILLFDAPMLSDQDLDRQIGES